MLSCERARDPMGFNSLQEKEIVFSAAACHLSVIHAFITNLQQQKTLHSEMIDPAVLLQVVTGKLVLSVKPFAFKVISKHSLTFVFTDYVTLQHFATA